MKLLNHIELLIVLFHVCAQAGQLFNRIYDLCLLSKRAAAADHVITRRTTATQHTALIHHDMLLFYCAVYLNPLYVVCRFNAKHRT